jgi:hypothetical protein
MLFRRATNIFGCEGAALHSRSMRSDLSSGEPCVAMQMRFLLEGVDVTVIALWLGL